MTTEIVADVSTLTPGQAELQARARAFVEEVLMPLEVEAERARGRLPAERIAEIRHAAIDRRLSGGLHAVEHGGQGWSHTEWFLVEEQLGRATNALSWHMPGAYNVLAHGTPAQIERYLKPALRGELHDAYAVTEEHAGSDPSRIATTATRIEDGWRIDREKWFVTYDATPAPAGKHLLSVFGQYAPYDLAERTWDSRREEVARQSIDLIDRFAPGFEARIEAYEVLGPPDIEQCIGLTGGNIHQGEVTPDQMWEQRLTPRTPVPGLYFCGAATGRWGCARRGRRRSTTRRTTCRSSVRRWGRDASRSRASRSPPRRATG
jgi:hypothetical protein